MRVLVCGAEGFLGSHVARRLQEEGHHVVRGVRHPTLATDVAIDYGEDRDAAVWMHRLVGIDAVVNAVGILRERRRGDFDRIHHRTPMALFEACRRSGVTHVVQISALGHADTRFLRSKRAADEALRRLIPTAMVVRPGLVFGGDGASTRLFLRLASLPIQFIPSGAGAVQPIHVDDVARIVTRLLEQPSPQREVDVPGPLRMNYAEWMTLYRVTLMKLAPTWQVPIPGAFMAFAATVASMWRNSPLTRETWDMLRAGNEGDPAHAQYLNGTALREPAHFVAAREHETYRLRALAEWRRVLLRAALAIVWLGTAAVSAGIYPIGGSLKLLSAYGMAGSLALAVLIGAIAFDTAMGLLTLLRPGRRLWLIQLGLVTAYTVLIAWRLPEYLAHPFAPILKNVAVAALLVQLWAEETVA